MRRRIQTSVLALLVLLMAVAMGTMTQGLPASAGGGPQGYRPVSIPSFNEKQDIEIILEDGEWIVGYGQTVTEYFRDGAKGATNDRMLFAYHGTQLSPD